MRIIKTCFLKIIMKFGFHNFWKSCKKYRTTFYYYSRWQFKIKIVNEQVFIYNRKKILLRSFYLKFALTLEICVGFSAWCSLMKLHQLQIFGKVYFVPAIFPIAAEIPILTIGWDFLFCLRQMIGSSSSLMTVIFIIFSNSFKQLKNEKHVCESTQLHLTYRNIF